MDNKLDIFYENNLVASIINLNDVEEGLSFFTHDEANIQFGTWNYKKGKELEPHFHNKFDRNATITQEAVFVLKGKVQCDLYNKKGQFISSGSCTKAYKLNQGSIIKAEFGKLGTIEFEYF